MRVHPFIEAERVAGSSVVKCCSLLKVSTSAFYERASATPSTRALSDATLTAQITTIHTESKGTYGVPRVHKALRKQGVECGPRRVRRLMRLAGLEGRCKKRFRTTTIADPDFESALDLIRRAFGTGAALNRRYVGDITYIATWEGWAYLATVIDLSSRRIVGWAMADHMRTELVSDALTMALSTRRPDAGVIFHYTRRRTSPSSPRATVSRCRSDARASAGTTPWPRASSRPSSASSSTRVPGRRAQGFVGRSSTTSRAGTTRSDCTARSTTAALQSGSPPIAMPSTWRHDHHTNTVRQTGSSPRRVPWLGSRVRPRCRELVGRHRPN